MSEQKHKPTCSICHLTHEDSRISYTHAFSEYLAAPLKASISDIAAHKLIGELEGKNISTITRPSMVQRMQAGR